MTLKHYIKRWLIRLGQIIFEKQLDELSSRIESLVEQNRNLNQFEKQLADISNKVELLTEQSKHLSKFDEFDEFMNELTHIRIESTNLCNYHCQMCPRDKMVRKRGTMPLEDLSWVLQNISPYVSDDYSGEIHLHDFGEPLLDTKLPNKILLVKQVFQKSRILIYTTLGEKLPTEHFEEMVQNGLSGIFVSIYGTNSSSYKIIHGVDRFETVMKNLEILRSIRKNEHFSVYVNGPFSPHVNYSNSNLIVTSSDERSRFRDLILNTYGFFYADSTLHNYGGKMEMATLMRSVTPCSVYNGSFRNQLNINWDLESIYIKIDLLYTSPQAGR